MNNAPFQFTPQATEDLDAIWWFIGEDNRDAADRVEKEILATCRRLAKFPLMGTRRQDITPLPVRFRTVTRFLNYILVDTLGFPIAYRVEPANISDRRAAVLLLSGLRPLFPAIRTVMADAGHESKKLARMLKVQEGWELRIIKRRQRAFQITGLTWIVERTFAWLGRNRRLSKDYEYAVQTFILRDGLPHLNPASFGGKSEKSRGARGSSAPF